MISLGILFEVEPVFAKKAKDMLQNSHINDWLYNFLLDSWDGEQTEINKEMLFPNNFSTLQKVVFQENKTDLLKRYLKNDWYNKALFWNEDIVRYYDRRVTREWIESYQYWGECF